MVERLVRNEEVWGSIPHGSTRDFEHLGSLSVVSDELRYHIDTNTA
jgi:hypothetical protein